ncbi:hypothetical protein EV282_0463 [Fictibacillus sp. BK138]|nr:hypothetical protein EV282_0463 [Fictibacillus sp. BK138]
MGNFINTFLMAVAHFGHRHHLDYILKGKHGTVTMFYESNNILNNSVCSILILNFIPDT